MTSSPYQLVASSTFGLEAVVARELTALGYTDQRTIDGRVFFRGDEDAICRSNLWLRSADRVGVVFGQFPARDFGILFDRTTELPWEQWIPKLGKFPVVGKSVKSQLHSVPDCQRIVKKAIVERLKRAYGVSWLDETGPTYEVEVSVLRDEVTLTIDTSGPGLHRRGYRRLNAVAPLRETLASALVQLSVWNPSRPFVDPCCGSGTIAIEAALLARNIAPGLHRDFAACDWPQIEASRWSAAREAATAATRSVPELKLMASDCDASVLELAKFHAKQAGVADCIEFRQRRCEAFHSKLPYGCWITNPPYGERLGDESEAELLYREMGEVWRSLDSWSFFVIAAHTGFEQLVERDATRRRKLFNGNLECHYFQFLGPRPPRSDGP